MACRAGALAPRPAGIEVIRDVVRRRSRQASGKYRSLWYENGAKPWHARAVVARECRGIVEDGLRNIGPWLKILYVWRLQGTGEETGETAEAQLDMARRGDDALLRVQAMASEAK